MTREAYFARVSAKLNPKWCTWGAIMLSVMISLVMAFNVQGKWYSISEGIPALCFRVFVAGNLYMLAYFLLKGIASVMVMRMLFDDDASRIELQPLHADGSAGLRPLADVCVSINYTLSVLVIYAVVGILLDSDSHRSIFAVLGPACIYPFVVGYMFFMPLEGAHKAMIAAKRSVLNSINRQFNHLYREIGDVGEGRISPEMVRTLEMVERLHRIASKMPEWPIDVKIAGKLFLAAGLPIVLALAVAFLKSWLGLA